MKWTIFAATAAALDLCLLGKHVAAEGRSAALGDAVSFLQQHALQKTSAWVTAPSIRASSPDKDPNRMTWHVGKAKEVVVNNMGGLGPDTGSAAEMRFHNVSVTDGGQILDLVVTASGKYDANDKTQQNGANNEIAMIFVKKGKANTFKFTFVNSGTSEEVNISRFEFTVLDIDQQAPDAYCNEMVTAWGAKSWYMLSSAYSTVKNITPNGIGVCSNVTINNGEVTNPQQIGTLSHAQARASIMFSYVNTASFEITFSNQNNGPRPLMFAGTATAFELMDGQWHDYFEEEADPNLLSGQYQAYHWSVGIPAHVTHNNLGGRGPNFDDPPEIRFKAVGLLHTVDKAHRIVNTTMLDLVATAEGQYWGSDFINKHWNGAQGDYGEIGLSRRSEATVVFTFCETDTSTPVVVPFFDFTIFDIDNQKDPAMGEEYTVIGASEYALRNDSFSIVDDSVPGQIRLISNVTVYDGAIENPESWVSLTEDQARASAQFMFYNTSHWTVHFKVTSHLERAFVFSGQSKPPLTEMGGVVREINTTAPTAAPTPAPTPGTTTVFGDPHLMNVEGAKFDILRPANHTFLTIPRGALQTKEQPLLDIQGEVTVASGDACTGKLYLTQLTITGSWLGEISSLKLSTAGEDFDTPESVGLEVGASGNLSVQDFASRMPPKVAQVQKNDVERPDKLNQHVSILLVRLYLGPTILRVTWEHQKEKEGFSNSLMLITYGLGQVPGEVGGLLGKEDHRWAATPPPECLGPQGTREGFILVPGRCGVRASAFA